jgi:hypothetical protein
MIKSESKQQEMKQTHEGNKRTCLILPHINAPYNTKYCHLKKTVTEEKHK